MPAFGYRFTGTTEPGFGLSGTDRQYRLGWRLNGDAAGSLSLSVGMRRRKSLSGDRPPEHGIGVRLMARWRMSG